jgi:Integrase core domain.
VQDAERPAADMISPQQHNKLMKEYEKRGRIGLSAAKAGVDRKTGAKYIGGAPGPLEPKPQRGWRTHEDAFGWVWPEMERRLDREPGLSAKTLWEELLREHGEKFRAGQRRSFERRVRRWKDRYGCEPELFFTQEHRAGERLQIDWVDCRELGVRIGGEAFFHKFVHVVLPFSNWEWARVCRSESFLSLKIGLQSAVWELGGVPQICQSDNSSTATHELGRGRPGRGYNARYLSLLAYYGMRPGLIAVGEAHQNGDVESAHNHLVVAIAQGLMLGGSREFGSVEDYENFVAEGGAQTQRGSGRAPGARAPGAAKTA